MDLCCFMYCTQDEYVQYMLYVITYGIDMQLVGDGGVDCSWWGMVGLTAVGGGWWD